LGHHLATAARILRPFALDKGGDAVLIQKEMVQAPQIAAACLARNAQLTPHQQPAARVVWIDLVAGDEVWILGQRQLQNHFLIIWRFRHRHPGLAGFINEKDF
jgi:hypothetical protein